MFIFHELRKNWQITPVTHKARDCDCAVDNVWPNSPGCFVLHAALDIQHDKYVLWQDPWYYKIFSINFTRMFTCNMPITKLCCPEFYKPMCLTYFIFAYFVNDFQFIGNITVPFMLNNTDLINCLQHEVNKHSIYARMASQAVTKYVPLQYGNLIS